MDWWRGRAPGPFVPAGRNYPRTGPAGAARPGDQASGGTTWGCAGSPR